MEYNPYAQVLGDQQYTGMQLLASLLCVVGDLAWLVRGLIAAASDSESAVLSWPLPPVSLMAARPRAKVTGALAPVQMALLTAITHSANQTARDGTPALPLPEPSPSLLVLLCICASGAREGA